MEFTGPLWLALAGMVIGGGVGFAVRRAKLCTFGAVEDAFVGLDTRRLRVFGLALGVAIVLTQALVTYGGLDPARTTYAPGALPWLGVGVGSVMFGFGMALVGTCSFGSLIRLGSGDLRSLVTMLVVGLFAYATLRGAFADFRIRFVESVAISMPPPGRADIPGLIEWLWDVDLRIWVAGIIGGILIALAAFDGRLLRSPRLVLGGVVLGLGIAISWAASLFLIDDFVQANGPQSLTFVSPVARAEFGILFGRDALLEFGVGSIVGVLAGSLLSAVLAQEFHWEAFDDPLEMKRHLGGAAMMGMGGVLCGGCTIGQGLSAGSMLALSAPLAIAGFAVGARLGIAVLMEGSIIRFARSMRWLPAPSAGRQSGLACRRLKRR